MIVSCHSSQKQENQYFQNTNQSTFRHYFSNHKAQHSTYSTNERKRVASMALSLVTFTWPKINKIAVPFPITLIFLFSKGK